VTPDDVLTEFGAWLEGWPDCDAKRWVMLNPPTEADAYDSAVRVLNIAMLRSWNLVAISCA
jgi:hypothetical protein